MPCLRCCITPAIRRLAAGLIAVLSLWSAATVAAPVSEIPVPEIPVPKIRVAALKFGTLNWELETIRRQQLDQAEGFALQVTPLAGMSATRTALISGAADVIVADWIWVSRQRAMGEPLQFVPFSTAIGELMLAKQSSIKTLADLQGKRIGIAGGPASKGWLLLRARALQLGVDLQATSEQQYGAPPLLNAALKQGRLDAVITFWHYAARLKAQGYPALLNIRQISRELGLASDLPMLGFVFRQSWADQQPQQVAALGRASRAAKQYLQQTASAWQPLRGMMKAADEATFEQLKQGYLAGIPDPLTTAQIDDAAQMYAVLHRVGGDRLMGAAATLDRASFRLTR